jgi:tagaturonate reductase
MADPLIKNFMQKTLYDEVIPTLDLPRDDLMSFAETVTGRFENPFIKHALLSICLNSVSKWRARCLPSLQGYYERKGVLPERLTFSLAALMALYQGGVLRDGALICERNGQPYTLRDDEAALAFFAENSAQPAAEQVRAFLSREDFFGADLTRIPGLADAVSAALEQIKKNGIRAAMEARFEN